MKYVTKADAHRKNVYMTQGRPVDVVETGSGFYFRLTNEPVSCMIEVTDILSVEVI